MATMKIGDKAVKADGYFNVNIYDNGYMMEIQIGRAHVSTPVTDVSRMPSSA